MPFSFGIEILWGLSSRSNQTHIDGALHPINNVKVAFVVGFDYVRCYVSPFWIDVVGIGIRSLSDM